MAAFPAATMRLETYRHPVPLAVLRFQIEIALREASDPSFVLEAFHGLDALIRR